MVFEDNCTQMILLTFPELAKSERWKEHVEFWKGKKAPFSIEMCEFSGFIADNLRNNEESLDFKSVFFFIEKLMIEGEQSVKDAAATCFLENLLNYYSVGDIEPASFIHLLGPESKAYCKAWDEFTGVRTPGLWDE